MQCSIDFLLNTTISRDVDGEVANKIFPSSFGVYGIDGLRKTMLLRKIYDTHLEVSDTFDVVIWVIVAQFPILKLQGAISCEINLELAETDVDKLMMKLTAYLRAKNIFLVLDYMWTSFDLCLV